MEGLELESCENKESCEINLEDFPFICRICLKRSDSRLYKVEDYLMELYLTITKINVRSRADLPRNVCMNCIKTLEDISLFADKSKNNEAKSRKHQKHVIKSEEYEDDLQYFNGFEICQICYSTNILKPVEGKAHLKQLFQDITNIVVEAEVTFSNRTSICNKCINELETISLFIRISVSNEMKLKNTIGRYEALENEDCFEGNAIDMGYGYGLDENEQTYEKKSLHTIIDLKEEIVDTSGAYVGQINRNVINIFCDSKSEDNPLDRDPCKDEFSTGTHLKNLSKGSEINHGVQSGRNRFICGVCDKSFSLKESLKRHIPTHSKERRYECNCCDKSFTWKGNLQKHMSIHAEENPFRCKCCEKRFNTKGKLRKHMLIHTGKRPFKCENCEKRFTQIGNLQNHMLIHSGEKPFICKCCEQSFTQKGGLRSHIRIHSRQKPFKCGFCGKRFNQKINIRKHLLSHTREKPFKCECCERSFTRMEILQKHMVFHSEERPFRCESCEKRFNHKARLLKHMLIHSGEKPFKCGCCEKRFNQKSNLRRHSLTHTGEKPFKCRCCEKGFIQKDHLQRHLLTHTGEKSFNCYYCKIIFSVKADLQKHVWTHDKENPSKCDKKLSEIEITKASLTL